MEAIRLLEELIWTYGKPAEIITDNGGEFISDEFEAVLNRYAIKHNKTSPGHPQTNGKVERLNHELIQRLQRISAEDGHKVNDWDLYLRQALFAFHAHENTRLGTTPFFLQHGVEPVLPSTSIERFPITPLELAEATDHRRKHVQNLRQYRAEAAEKYTAALKRLAAKRDDTTFVQAPIRPGDLVMRTPINRKSKLHPKWDGPFVVLASTVTDNYQLATANGYVVRNLVNVSRLRKLFPDETKRYTDDFWNASSRLRSQDKHAHDQAKLREIEGRLAQATADELDAQKQGKRADLTQIAELSTERRKLSKNLSQGTSADQSQPAPTTSSEAFGVGKRIRRLPFKLR
jgi:hypothetical protein